MTAAAKTRKPRATSNISELSIALTAAEQARTELAAAKAEIADLRAQIDALHARDTEHPTPSDLEAMRAEPAAQAPAARVPHATYWDYVRACKALARHRGQRVASYAPQAVWEKRVAAYRASQH